jgi:hypothetical protein
MAENEATPEVPDVKNEVAEAPKTETPAVETDANATRRSRRERPARPERVKPERPVRVRAERATRVKPERGRPSAPPFELSFGPNLGKDFDRIMKSAFNEAAKAVEEQLESKLQFPDNTDPKETRELEKIRKTVAKTLGKALGTFGTRLLSQGDPSFASLKLDADGNRALAGPIALELSPSAVSRFVGQVTSLRPLLIGETPPLKGFTGMPEKIEASYGNSLDNNYFLTGTTSFSPSFDAPEDSEFSYTLDLFAKRGKQMGMRLQFSASHNLKAQSFKSEVKMEIPLEKPAVISPAKKTTAAKPKKA